MLGNKIHLGPVSCETRKQNFWELCNLVQSILSLGFLMNFFVRLFKVLVEASAGFIV